MSIELNLTVKNFFSELIFYPGHAATSKEQTNAKVITVALGIFTLGIVHAIVGFGWILRAAVNWVRNQFSSTDQKTQNISGKNQKLENFDPEVRKQDLQNQLKEKYENQIKDYDDYLDFLKKKNLPSSQEFKNKEILISALQVCYKAKYEDKLTNLDLGSFSVPPLTVGWNEVQKEIKKAHNLFDLNLGETDLSDLNYKMQANTWEWRKR